ncbi:MAG TPA: Minf_1886 family protein [Candidatus Binatia bacterium]|nr:Minf_1886 family protein [Candidatus Binatia bacterium]
MEALDFDKTVEEVVQRDPRYHREAYGFVRDALDYTQKNIVRTGKEGLRHVSGQELLEGIRAYALHVYGPMAMLVLNEWGLQRCEDFGNIVFNLIESGLFAKTDQDQHQDFKGGYLFEEAFKKPFVPNIPADAVGRQASIPTSERQSESVDPA